MSCRLTGCGGTTPQVQGWGIGLYIPSLHKYLPNPTSGVQGAQLGPCMQPGPHRKAPVTSGVQGREATWRADERSAEVQAAQVTGVDGDSLAVAVAVGREGDSALEHAFVVLFLGHALHGLAADSADGTGG